VVVPAVATPLIITALGMAVVVPKREPLLQVVEPVPVGPYVLFGQVIYEHSHQLEPLTNN